MDVQTALAAAPWLKRAWKVVPAPLRIPLVIAGVVVWVVKRRNDDGGATSSGTDVSTDTSTGAASTPSSATSTPAAS